MGALSPSADRASTTVPCRRDGSFVTFGGFLTYFLFSYTRSYCDGFAPMLAPLQSLAERTLEYSPEIEAVHIYSIRSVEIRRWYRHLRNSNACTAGPTPSCTASILHREGNTPGGSVFPIAKRVLQNWEKASSLMRNFNQVVMGSPRSLAVSTQA